MFGFVVGRGVQLFLLVVTMKVGTTLMSPDEMARIFLITSAVNFYAMLLLNPVGMFIGRRLHSWNVDGKVGIYIRYYWYYLFLCSLIAVGSLAVCVGGGFLDFHTNINWTLSLVGCTLIISTSNLIVIFGLNLLGFRGYYVYLTLASTFTSLVSSVFLVELFGRRAEFWLVGALIGQLLIGLVGSLIFYRKLNVFVNEGQLKIGITPEKIQVIWSFTWPILICFGLVWVQTQSYRFFMESELGLVKVGMFVAGYAVSSGIISGFESVLTTYFQPAYFRKLADADRVEQGNAWSTYANSVLPSMLLVTFLVIALAPELTRMLLGRGYSESAQFVIWGAAAELARVASGVYGLIAQARMKTKILLLPNLVGGGVAIIMICLLMPKYGSVGVGWALALAGVGVFVSTFVSTRDEFLTTLQFKSIRYSILIGLLLILEANFARQIIAKEDMFSALMLLCLSAIIYIPTQFFILRPIFISKKQE